MFQPRVFGSLSTNFLILTGEISVSNEARAMAVKATRMCTATRSNRGLKRRNIGFILFVLEFSFSGLSDEVLGAGVTGLSDWLGSCLVLIMW